MLPLQQLQLFVKALHESLQLFLTIPSFISLVHGTDEQGQDGINGNEILQR